VAQQAWLNAFSHRDSFRGDSAFYTWLTRIAVNAGVTMAREASVRPDGHAAELTPKVARMLTVDDRTEPRLIAARELRLREARMRGSGIGAATARRYADVYRMRFVLGMRVRPVADALGMCENTVKMYTHRLRLRMTV
jgi:RNA polymerase sigma-70 factor (ECF subfamily)